MRKATKTVMQRKAAIAIAAPADVGDDPLRPRTPLSVMLVSSSEFC
jgi:hypothetical protein